MLILQQVILQEVIFLSFLLSEIDKLTLRLILPFYFSRQQLLFTTIVFNVILMHILLKHLSLFNTLHQPLLTFSLSPLVLVAFLFDCSDESADIQDDIEEDKQSKCKDAEKLKLRLLGDNWHLVSQRVEEQEDYENGQVAHLG